MKDRLNSLYPEKIDRAVEILDIKAKNPNRYKGVFRLNQVRSSLKLTGRKIIIDDKEGVAVELYMDDESDKINITFEDGSIWTGEIQKLKDIQIYTNNLVNSIY